MADVLCKETPARQHVLIRETNLATAGHDVWHLYSTNERADLKELARLLCDDDGTSWDVIKEKGWDVVCEASSEFDNKVIPNVKIDATFYENEFLN